MIERMAEQSMKIVKGEIDSFDPSTGRGLVRSDGREFVLDLSVAKLLNPGYVRFNRGRNVQVEIDSDIDGSLARTIKAL